ncbi:UDP-N-acetylglucosamine transferase subunit [Aphanomyces cochlioides]|nr:UDP-N-acetylglucosamine transferase subunit [Aphanomyces cochlioides]
MIAAFLGFVALAAVLSVWRLRCILPRRGKRTVPSRKLPPSTSVRTLVVLGSGGHTTEILKLIKRLSTTRYTPLAFVVAATDHTSQEKARIERKGEELQFFTIPRSREVGQSWLTTVFTTAYSFLYSMWVVIRFQPDLLLCNGPGTCIPICAAVLLLRFLGIKTHSKILFCESFARVQRLSMSGKILYPIADEFIVHWPELQAQYPHAKYLGTIC